MPTLAEIRAGLGPAADQFTDEQLYNAAMTAFAPLYSNPKVLQSQLGYDPNRDFARGGEIALRNTGAALAGAGAAVADTVGWEGGRDSMLGMAQRQQTRAQQLGRTYDDVDNFGQNPLGFLSSAAGQAIGYAVPSLVGGGVAGLGAKMLGRSALAGYGLGAGASNLAQETGGIYNELAEQGIYDPGRALMYGAPAAALDTASEMVPFLKGAGTGNVLRRMGTGALKQAGTEAGTEVLQTGIERAGAYKDVLSPEAWHEYRNAAALGAIGGGMFGGAMGLQRPEQPAQAKPPVTDDPLNPTDLLTVERGFDARRPLDGFVPEGPRPGSRVVGAPAEVPQWGLARGAMDPAPTHPTVGEATDLFRMPTDGEPRIVGGYDPRLAGLFVGPTQPGAAPFEFSPPMTYTAVPPLSPPVAVDPLGAVTGPLYVDDVAEGNSRWREQPADIASPVIGRMEGGRQTPISGADDPGLALARQRYEEQLRQAEQTRTTNEAVQAKAEEQRREAERVQGILGGKIKPGSKVVGMVQELEAQLKAGVIDQSTFENDAALLSNNQLGTVRKNIDARNKEQANAAGAGTDGAARPADVGRGAGDQRAPGQPGGVRPAAAQPAAQGVVGAGTAELGTRTGGGDGALTGDQIVERIQQLDPVEQAYVGRWLGVDLDDEGNLALREQGAESLRAMEKSLGVSYETVRERVKAALVKLGLPKGMKPKQLYEQLGLTAANTDLETLERNVDMSTPASEAGTGDLDTVVESTSEDALDGVGDTDVRVERAQTASDELVPEIPDQDPTGRQREVAGPIDEGSMDVEDRVDESRALTLDSALEGDVSAGRVTADDIAEAQFFYEQNRRHGMQPWGRLNAPTQAEFVRVYARARLAADPAVLTTKKALYEDTQRTVGRGGSAVDSGATRGTESRSTDGRDTAAQEGDAGVESGGSAIQAARGPVPVVTKRKRRVVQPERADEDVNWGNQLASAEEGGATLDRSETTKVTREQVLSQGPFAKAAESLRALGLGHMLDWVGEWRSAGDRDTDVADGWLEGYGTQYVLTLKDASALGTSANATWVMLHEVGHAADLAPSGGVYSAHPDMRFEMANGRAVGRGAVAAEMAELYENDPWWSAVLQYPLDARRYGVTDGETVAGELFAQLFAMYVDPKGRAKLQLDAPLAFQFIQESVNDIQATRPLRVRTPGEVKGRAQAFARRYRGVSSGQSTGTAAGGNASAGGRALRAARSALNKIGKSRGRMPDLAALIVDMRDAGLEAAARFLGRADVRELLDKLAQHASITDIDRYTEFWRDELSGGDKDARFPGDYNFGRVQVRNAVGPRDVYKFKVSDELAQDLEAIDIATNNIFNQFMEERGKPTLPEAPTYPGKDPFYHDERMKNPQYAREYAAYERQIRAANARMDAAHNEFARRYGISPRDYGDSSLEFRNPPPFEALYDGDEDPHPEDRDPARIAQERLWALLNSIADARKVAAVDAASDSVNRLVGSVSKPLRSARNSAADHVAALRQATQSLPQPAQNAWTDIKDFAARKMPYVMTTFQIFEQFGSKLKRLGDMLRANDLMRQESLSLQMKIDEIVKRWDKLPKAAGELLTDVATRATMLGAYPEKAWADKDNAHVPRERQAEYEELRRLYERMKSTSPEALKLYHETLDAFEAQRQQLEAATKRMFEQHGKTLPKPKRTPGPYFPLVRRGDYLAIGESPQLVALKKRLEQAQVADADEATITDLNEQIDQLEKDDQHFWVSSHEKRSGMEQALKEYERRGLVARRSLASQRLDGLPTRNIHSTIAALTAEATKNLSKDGAKEVGNALAEILLRSLPEGHALERQASRRNISGAMQDMKRAVAVAGRQNAYYIARLNHAKEVSDALFEMGRDVKGDINLQHVHRELEQRHALNMQWHETPIQDAIGKAGWMWYLGASPMFLMMNAAQPWLVSAPVMAGQYGASAASRELSRATADALTVLKKARWTGGKFDLWSGIDPDTIQSRFKTRNAKGEEIGEDRKAVRELILRGVIDEGLSPELAMYAESGGTGMLTKLSRFVSWPSRQIELVNRVATALAAFRLERGVTKAGETAEQAYERALERAYATVVNTHVDYGAENAPRAMREGGGIPLAKLIFQFRRYQQAMLYLLASNVKKLRDPNEQKVARATLAYLAITSGMAGGAIGLPLAGTAMFLADLFGDDDDEDGDTRTKLRNALRDLTGDKTTADVLAKGLPALFGFDIAERVGMGQVGQLFPRLDLSRSKTAEDKVAKTLLAVAGPGAGLAVQGMDAASFFGAGDFWRGAERLSPKMVADLMRAGREGLTGVEDRKGEMLLSPEERSIGDTIRRALGASSVRESDRFAADKALKDVERGMNARRDRIHTEFRRALRSGDFEDVREMIDEYNADHPDAPIKPKDELAWRKEAQRAGRERDPETGLKVTRRQQPLAEVQRFAQP